MRLLFLGGLLALVTVAWPIADANADFTSATLVSGNPQIPFDRATNPTFAGNGRYVVMQGFLAGVPGVYRRDLATGEVMLVAGALDMVPGASEAERAMKAPDATAPSSSADGRYVAFTSAAVLDTADDIVTPQPADTGGGCPQVYVRDMDLPPGAPGAYTLASALNGTSIGLTYANSCSVPPQGQLAAGGAQAAAGVALSADGRKVVFTVLSPSNLMTGANFQSGTPASQVAVRDLDARTTTLVTATPIGQPTEGGGAFPSTESQQQEVVRPLETTSDQPVGSSAAISADGSTVAWLGTNVPAQVPPATDITDGMNGLGPVATEVEPLWRRVADGSGAVTKRLLTGAGLNFYFPGSKEEPQAVNGGTLYPAKQDFVPPVLSADGRTVAVIANAPSPANEGSYRYLGLSVAPPSDAYVIHVNGNPSAPPNVTPLTATPNFTAQGAVLGGVRDIAISSDGSRVAFNTTRTSFALAPPTLISPPAPETTTAYTYEANIQLGVLQRVTSTYDGSAPNGDPGLISFSGDGLSLAFASTAGNLLYGSPTPVESQIYLAHETPVARQVAPQLVSPAPATPVPLLNWVLSATASAQTDGSVLVDAQVPGAGRLGVRASAQLPTAAGGAVRRNRYPGSHRVRHASASRNPRKKTRINAGVRIPARTVAQGETVTGGPSGVQLHLGPAARYRRLVASRNGLYALLRVTFAARGHKTLVQEIPVTFGARTRHKGRA